MAEKRIIVVLRGKRWTEGSAKVLLGFLLGFLIFAVLVPRMARRTPPPVNEAAPGTHRITVTGPRPLLHYTISCPAQTDHRADSVPMGGKQVLYVNSDCSARLSVHGPGPMTVICESCTGVDCTIVMQSTSASDPGTIDLYFPPEGSADKPKLEVSDQ